MIVGACDECVGAALEYSLYLSFGLFGCRQSTPGKGQEWKEAGGGEGQDQKTQLT